MKADFIKHRIIQVVFVTAAVLLSGKLAHLQLIDPNLKERAENLTLQRKTIYPSRGMIFDRSDELLVVNKPSYDLKVTFNKIDPKMDTTKFCEILGITKIEFIDNLNKNWKSPRFSKSVPFTFLSKIDFERFSVFQEHLHEFPGFQSLFRSVRSYPHKNAAHVLGYLSEVEEFHIKDSEGKLVSGDYIGVSGLEKNYDEALRGSKGLSLVLRDNLGREVSALENGTLDSVAISGIDLRSTIDLELQQYGETLFSNKKGSVVALEPSTGEILAMISAPNYDPNDMSLNKDRKIAYQKLIADDVNKPFLDRSVMAKYPPGSIFKPVLALIALQEGILYPNKTIQCKGYFEINSKGQSQGCRDHPTPYNVQIALQHSCNTYFYQTIKDFIEIEGFKNPGVGLDLLGKYLKEFGIGQRLGVDNSHEHPGNFPSSKYFDDFYKPHAWRASAILSLGIGQGEMELTTLQMANLSAIIANKGHYYTPHLVKEFLNSDKTIPEIYTTKKELSINKEYFKPVIEGMHSVVTAGSGYAAYVPGLDICGKTGTSQNPHGNRIDHSVFIAFAPKDDPKIAIAVFVENAGGGSAVAAPIAGLMIEKYLNKEVKHVGKEEYITNIDLLNKS